MKTILSSCFLALSALLAVCSPDDVVAQAPAMVATKPAVSTNAENHASKIPATFISYASQSIGNNRLCVVGTSSDDDGMKQRPVVYVTDAASHQVDWVARPGLPLDMYQARATHCSSHGNALFVLLQSDTQSEQTLSQTLLRVVRLDPKTGAVQVQQDVDVAAAYSAWVDEGSSHFQWLDDRLVISGNDRLDSNHDRQGTFTLRLNTDLKVQKE